MGYQIVEFKPMNTTMPTMVKQNDRWIPTTNGTTRNVAGMTITLRTKGVGHPAEVQSESVPKTTT